MKPIVAVSMRVVETAPYAEPRDAISHDWIRWFDTVGATPLLVPNLLADPAAYARRMGASALLLTGGNDVGSSPDRDRTETALLAAALEARMPVLAVCRGLQFVNVFFGGSLTEDLSPFGRHAGVTHPVRLDAVPGMPDPPADARVNSFHNQGVQRSGLAPDLIPFASTDEGLVEGFVHRSAPLIAVQWHPERENAGADLDRVLVRRWMDPCS